MRFSADKSVRPIRVRIKPGTRVFQDFGYYAWPADLAGMEFNCRPNGLGGFELSAPGYGENPGTLGYGNGPLFL